MMKLATVLCAIKRHRPAPILEPGEIQARIAVALAGGPLITVKCARCGRGLIYGPRGVTVAPASVSPAVLKREAEIRAREQAPGWRADPRELPRKKATR